MFLFSQQEKGEQGEHHKGDKLEHKKNHEHKMTKIEKKE
jgi:hypothetical protein